MSVLEYLYAQLDTWSTASSIAANLGISVRTVKNYVAWLNDRTEPLVESSSKGFRIKDRAVAAELLAQTKNEAIQTAKKRRSYVLRRLLIESEQCSLESLAAELYVSVSTLERELRQAKPYLKDYGLTLQIKKGEVSIAGAERNKKRIISTLIYEETKNFFNNMELLNDYFPEIDLRLIRKTVEDTLAAHQCFLNDYSISNLILHIAITLQRNIRGLCTGEEEPSNRKVAVSPEHCAIVAEICHALEQTYPIVFSDSDQYAFGVIITTRLVHLQDSEAEDMLETSVRQLVLLIVKQVEQNFAFNIGNADFIVRFGLHLKNLLIRYHGGILLRNPQAELIKNNYPYIYDIAVFIAGVIYDQTQVRIGDDEIAYIAMHVGGLIEEQNAERSKVKVVLISPQYYAGVPAVWQRLSRVFSDSLLVRAVMRSTDGLSTLHDIELVISTIAVDETLSIPVVQISPFGSQHDDTVLRQKIETIRRQRLQTEIRDKLQVFFKPQLFFAEPTFADQSEAIRAMGNALYENGYVGEDFTAKLFERENVSSSAYANIALPHPLDMDARRTAIAVALLQQPMQWGPQKVNLIMMLAITREDRPLFRSIFDFVTESIVDPQRLAALLKTTSYTEFINLLISGSEYLPG